MPRLHQSVEFMARLSMERERVDLFLRLTQEGMSSDRAMARLDEEAPFRKVDGEGGSRMSEHERELTEDELLTCNICAQTFSTEDFLSRHMTDDHDIEPV